MRIRNGCLFVTLAALLVALSTVALGEKGGEKEGQYDISGTWYAINSFGNYLVYTITRTGPNEYTSLGDSLTGVDPLGWGSTRLTTIGATIRRTGRNTYEYTSLIYYGDDNTSTPMYFGVMFAAVYSGTIVQTGPDELKMTLYGKASCNPCWPDASWRCQTDTACDLSEPWDAFNDPDALCGGAPFNPLYNVSHRVPIDSPCTPPSS